MGNMVGDLFLKNHWQLNTFIVVFKRCKEPLEILIILKIRGKFFISIDNANKVAEDQ